MARRSGFALVFILWNDIIYFILIIGYNKYTNIEEGVLQWENL